MTSICIYTYINTFLTCLSFSIEMLSFMRAENTPTICSQLCLQHTSRDMVYIDDIRYFFSLHE